MTNENPRGLPVLWRAPHGSGEKWMYFDHEPAHLPIRESLVSGADYAALLAERDELRAEPDAWISVDESRPARNEPAIYWHRGEFGGCGYIAFADEWRDEHHLPFATHWKPATPPAAISAMEGR